MADLSSDSPEVLEYLEHIRKTYNDYMDAQFPGNVRDDRPETATTPNYIKVVHEGAAHSFVARRDLVSKELGQVLKGDILYAASWRQPAKHTRGNVLAADRGMGALTNRGGVKTLR